jgi:hypothetical protein
MLTDAVKAVRHAGRWIGDGPPTAVVNDAGTGHSGSVSSSTLSLGTVKPEKG